MLQHNINIMMSLLSHFFLQASNSLSAPKYVTLFLVCTDESKNSWSKYVVVRVFIELMQKNL